MMLLISIDGACRRNGKPDCVSAGGVFIQRLRDGMVVDTTMLSCYEHKSTNQRGELLALLTALDHIYTAKTGAWIVTDSEYIFNAMTKQWYANWQNKGWITASGEQVKNRDIWMEIAHAMSLIPTEVMFYHIKGHCISFGRVTATRLLEKDSTGQLLFLQVFSKYHDSVEAKADVFKAAQELSVKNNGYELPKETFERFVIANTMADAIATKVVDAADRER